MRYHPICVLTAFMTQIPRNRTQDLREAFASIISMMLGLLRAHGVRGLIHLPALWLAAAQIRRIDILPEVAI